MTAICLPQTDLDNARTVAERLRLRIEEGVVQDAGAEIRVTASIGLSEVGAEENEVTAALSRADEALYSAKENGRNRVQVAAE